MLQNSPQTWPTPSTLSPTPSKQKQESEMSSSLFTVAQWQELEHQALIFKYLKSGFPVPPDLLVPIRRSFQLMSPSFFCQPTSLGYCSYIGKKIDPEPGRCRRTDGKKWRCSQEAHPDSKYCERHMNRGRYRSRKLVELRTTASKSLSTVPSEAANGSSSSTGSFQKTPLQSEANCKFLCFGGNATQLQDDSLHYGTSNNGHSGLRRMTLDLGKDNFLPEASGSMRCDGTDTGFDSSWHFAASQIPFSSSSEPISSSLMLSNNQQQRFQDIEPPNVDSLPSKQEQHCFFGKELGVPVSVKQEHNMLQPLFNQWSETKDLGSYPENHRSSKDLLTTTQLSMSSATSDFFTRNDQSHSDAYR